MPIANDATNDVYGHVGGAELENNSAPAIGHESDFVKEQVVLALEKESRLQATGGVGVQVTADEIVLQARWVDEEQRALAERIARSLAVGRQVTSTAAR